MPNYGIINKKRIVLFNEDYYFNLIVTYYDIQYPNKLELKRKYNKDTLKEVWEEMDKREKEVLRLQSIVLEKRADVLIKKVFSSRKDAVNSINMFKTTLFLINTENEIDFRTYRVCREVLDYIDGKPLKDFREQLDFEL